MRDFADHVNDFETVMQEVVLPDCPPPYYVLAHSTGATIALLSAERLRTQIDRMVLTAPLLALPYGVAADARAADRLPHAFRARRGLRARRRRHAMQTQPFDGNLLTSDEARYQRTLAIVDADPAISVGGATIGWVNAAMRACIRLAEPDFAETVPMPVLIVLGGADRVVSNLAAEEFSRRVKTAAHLDSRRQARDPHGEGPVPRPVLGGLRRFRGRSQLDGPQAGPIMSTVARRASEFSCFLCKAA